MLLFDEISRPDPLLAGGVIIRVRHAKKPCHIQVSQNEERLRLNIVASRDVAIDITEAISWLFAAVYSAEELAFSHVRLDLNQSQAGQVGRTFTLSHHRRVPLSRSDLERADTCWRHVVPKTAIAAGFDVPKRNLDLKGMDVSYELLLGLCGVEYETAEGGRIVLYGPKSKLFPVRLVNGCVEWHFQIRDDTDASPHGVGEYIRRYLTILRRYRIANGTSLDCGQSLRLL